MSFLVFVNCENTFLISMKRDLDAFLSTTLVLFLRTYVPVKSQLQHSPGQPLRAFEFLKNICSNPRPSPGLKAVQMTHHRSISGKGAGKLSDYCFNFSVPSIMLLKLCM